MTAPLTPAGIPVTRTAGRWRRPADALAAAAFDAERAVLDGGGWLGEVSR